MSDTSPTESLAKDITPPIDYREITAQGLWKNNAALVQLLGLCPLLAVSGSIVNALGLGLATMAVLMGSNVAVSLIRHKVTDAVRLPVFVMIIATFTTCIELMMQAFAYELYQILGIFIALIVTNCAILGRADAFACKNPPLAALWDGLMMGLGFALVLVVVGAIRELLGNGTLFADMHLLLGEFGRNWTINIHEGSGMLVAVLPPGAFLVTGFLVALKNKIDSHLEAIALRQQTPTEKVSRRVRTTGKIA